MEIGIKGIGEEDGRTYRMFLGLIIKHHRVQIAPVQESAKFWVRDSFSAGRAKSEIPARTRDHYNIC